MQDKLHITVVQPDLVWENVAANFLRLENLLAKINTQTDVVVLPEMFTTAFTMQPQKVALRPKVVIDWLHAQAQRLNCLMMGSAAIVENERYYNRLFAVLPDKTHFSYDKRHLFSLMQEQNSYERGTKKLIFEYKGWRIMPLICYDLRFAGWAQNNSSQPYDLLIYVANWPQKRIFAWQTLLKARAIENQCVVIGANRVGYDQGGAYHNGASVAINAVGEVLHEAQSEECTFGVEIRLQDLKKTRAELPFLQDIDN